MFLYAARENDDDHCGKVLIYFLESVCYVSLRYFTLIELCICTCTTSLSISFRSNFFVNSNQMGQVPLLGYYANNTERSV